ncbi:MAG: pyridoxal-dependent decarboxylase [Phycisphaerales bacterium]
MSAEDFRAAGHAMIDWIADYLDGGVTAFPVLSRANPGEIAASVGGPPQEPEAWAEIWREFERDILPGVTHWQSPQFFAYFPANTSFPAILGELLSAGLGVNGMLWSTSPACTELEERVLDWLVDLLGLPEAFKGGGVIQDTASSASLCALLAAREQSLEWAGNVRGLGSCDAQLVVYTSDQAHSSIEKAAMIAGVGRRNCRLIDTDSSFALRPDALKAAVTDDLNAGRRPCFVSATLGTTSSLASDPIRAIGEICRAHDIWLHVDAAMAGTALLCPEFRSIADGLEFADSFCFNPHKWMFTNFDLDAFYVRNPERLVRTLSIDPEYLQASQADHVVNYRDWHVPLGRRFRALKLWFVIRTFGVEALRDRIRRHVQLAREFAIWMEQDPRFELVSPQHLNLVCFRLRGGDEVNRRLLDRINADGRMHLTHTRLNDRFTLRLCVGQTTTERSHVENAWSIIQTMASEVTGGQPGMDPETASSG